MWRTNRWLPERRWGGWVKYIKEIKSTLTLMSIGEYMELLTYCIPNTNITLYVNQT